MRAVLFDFAETLFFPEEMPQRIRGGLSLLGNGQAYGPEIDRIADEIESAFESEVYLATKDRRDLSAGYHRAAFTAAFSAAEGIFEGLADAMYDRLTDPASWTPFPDAKPTLDSLHQHGIRVGVVSNFGFDIRPIFSHHGLSDFVEAFALSFEHGIIKPDPALFEIAMRALDVRPMETVMVGDNVADSGAVLARARVYLLPPVVLGTERGLAEILTICTITSARSHLVAGTGGRFERKRDSSQRCVRLFGQYLALKVAGRFRRWDARHKSNGQKRPRVDSCTAAPTATPALQVSDRNSANQAKRDRTSAPRG